MSSGTAQGLTWEKAVEAFRAFFREKPLVVFGTGPSCAVDLRFGMAKLAERLRERIPQLLPDPSHRAEWGDVDALLKANTDLETALTRDLSGELVAVITAETGQFVAGLDREYEGKLRASQVEWPLLPLLRKLVGSYTNEPALHVVTPNYDLLLEHACDAAGMTYTTGFVGGVNRTLNWGRAACSMRRLKTRLVRRKLKRGCEDQPHIRLHKVHGSLNTFLAGNRIVENNAWMWDPPSGVERVMVTPGNSKYQRVLEWRNELLRRADAAVKESGAILFVGYGMNDSHLDGEMRRKLVDAVCPGLIVTMESNDRIEALLGQASKFWLVCGVGPNAQDGTRIVNRDAGELTLKGARLWDIREFTREVLEV